MATAASNRPDAQSEAPHPGATGRARIGIAGATGYAGQELVKILAPHPGVTLTTAMASAATSTPRAMPALARIWDQPVVPLAVDRLRRAAAGVMPAPAAGAAGGTSPPRARPALARFWDQPVVPLDVDRLVRDADVVMLALPEA